MCRARARETGAWIVYVNLVGGQDELVFDGGSMVVSPDGELAWHAAMFEEDLLVVDLDVPEAPEAYPGPGRAGHREAAARPTRREPPGRRGRTRSTGRSSSGLGDYVRKNGFREVALGLSGGHRLGARRDAGGRRAWPAGGSDGRHAVAVLVRREHRGRARGGAAPGRPLRRDPHRRRVQGHLSALEDVFRGTPENVAEENLQARIRGNLLMALSNKFGSMVLATGNKSEYSVGYATLYGDMAGGFAPIKDVPKTLVYELCRWRNEEAARRGETPPIPDAVMTKAPTAELRPDQKDTDSLPPYDVLDPILEGYVEDDRSRGRPDRRPAWTRRPFAGSRAWSTPPSTSAGRRRRG